MNLFRSDPEGHDIHRWAEAFLATLPFARTSGMTVVGLDQGRASLMLPARPTWSGDVDRGRIHTGCLCALADTACGIAVGTALEAMEPIATLDLRMDYLRSADVDKDLVCHARCQRLARSVAFARGELRQPGRDEVIAVASATFMRATPNSRRSGTGGGHPAPGASSAVDPPVFLEGSQPAVPEGRSPYVGFLGVVQYPQDGAGPVFRLPFRPDLIGNPALPALHGGVLAGFCETAMIMHLVATNAEFCRSVPKAVDFSLDYLRSARAMDTFAQGTVIRQGNRVALVQVSAWQDDPLRPVAFARGHCLMPVPGAPG